MSYDKIFRKRVIEYKDAGDTFKQVIDKSELLLALEEHPDWYLREFAEKFNVCPQAVDKMFKKPGVTRKKKYLKKRHPA